MIPFEIGHRVVCVREPTGCGPEVAKPIVGAIYTVRGLPELDGEVGVWLVEIINPVRSYATLRRNSVWIEKSFNPTL